MCVVCSIFPFLSRYLQNLGHIEQTLVTAVDKDGKEMKEKELVKMLETFLVEHGPAGDELLTDPMSLRLLMLFVITQDGMTSGQRKTLFQAASLDAGGDVESTLMNLQHLGVALAKTKEKKRTAEQKASIKEAKVVAMRDEQLKIARVTPAIDGVVRRSIRHYHITFSVWRDAYMCKTVHTEK
jgi:hypothetical protein